jgi:hypothetical protein
VSVPSPTVERVDTLPSGPIESDPIDYYHGRDFADLGALLDEALDGVELGAYDRRIVDWAKQMWDQPTMVTIASLIQRARALR